MSLNIICMESNMGYHSVTQFYKTFKFNCFCSKTSKCTFALYSVALATTVTDIDD